MYITKEQSRIIHAIAENSGTGYISIEDRANEHIEIKSFHCENEEVRQNRIVYMVFKDGAIWEKK